MKKSLKPVEKPSRRYRKGSKYDPIQDDLKAMKNSSRCMERKDEPYPRTQNKRIETRGLEDR